MALVKYSAFAGSRDLFDGILDKFASIFLKGHKCCFSRQHSQNLTFILVLAVNQHGGQYKDAEFVGCQVAEILLQNKLGAGGQVVWVAHFKHPLYNPATILVNRKLYHICLYHRHELLHLARVYVHTDFRYHFLNHMISVKVETEFFDLIFRIDLFQNFKFDIHWKYFDGCLDHTAAVLMHGKDYDMSLNFLKNLGFILDFQTLNL